LRKPNKSSEFKVQRRLAQPRSTTDLGTRLMLHWAGNVNFAFMRDTVYYRYFPNDYFERLGFVTYDSFKMCQLVEIVVCAPGKCSQGVMG